ASFIANLIELSLLRSEASTMRLPSLTISPPMIAGSTFISICTSCLVTALRASLRAARWGSESFSATVTWAVTSPLCPAPRARPRGAVGGEQGAPGDRGALGGEEREKLRPHPADPGLVEHALERLGLVVGGEHRASHQAAQILAVGEQRLEALEIRLHGVDRL